MVLCVMKLAGPSVQFISLPENWTQNQVRNMEDIKLENFLHLKAIYRWIIAFEKEMRPRPIELPLSIS